MEEFESTQFTLSLTPNPASFLFFFFLVPKETRDECCSLKRGLRNVLLIETFLLLSSDDS